MLAGTAIYVNSLLFSLSPIYTVTLDGNDTDIDGVRPTIPLTCNMLFSKTNLDPIMEHEIRVSIKELSPTRNQSYHPNDAYVFSLVNFM